MAESAGIERGEVPDLTRAPASLLEALEAHLFHLGGGRGAQQPALSRSSAQQVFKIFLKFRKSLQTLLRKYFEKGKFQE